MIATLFSELPLIGRFAVIFGLIILLPKLSERVGLPGIVGLMAGGIVLGPHLLGLLTATSGALPLFAELGKLLLMFFAGYEVNFEQFRRVQFKSLGFGVLTFTLPLMLGAVAALAFGNGLNSAVLIGSLLASHTLIALPIVQNLGLMNRDSIVITIGATMITDIAAMLVLAVCLSVHISGFSPQHLTTTLVGLLIYVPAIVFGLSSFVRWLFGFIKPSAEMRLGALILMMAVAAFVAEAIEIEGIVGAFLSGLAVKRGLGDSREGELLSVISHTLFIPVFFLSTGFLVDLPAFARTFIDHGLLVVAIVGTLILSKYLAAEIAGRLFRLGLQDRRIMWSLSIPQVAATLAAGLVAYNTINAAGERLINESTINTIIVLVLATSVLGPVLTRNTGRKLQQAID